MAILENGLETMELGATAWRIIINNNFTKIFTKDELNAKLKDGSLELKVNKIGTSELELNAVLNASPLPQNIDGYIKIKVNGIDKKIPFYDL